jgi:hypothetical protein
LRFFRWLRRRQPTPPSELGDWHVTFTCPSDAYANLKRQIIAQGGEVFSAVRTNPSQQSPSLIGDKG